MLKDRQCFLLACGVCLFFALFFFYHIDPFHTAQPRIVFFDVGQGDAVFFENGNGFQMLIDTGRGIRY